MPLKEYQQKRDFKKTKEPKGKINKSAVGRFVVQEHYASHLHYDFRLALDGVLKSWAVPKGIPKKKGVKHLAVQVEDHPLDYLNFRGTIPEGEYGAGTVKIWDKGDYLQVNEEQLKITSKIKSFKVELRGRKLKGEYALVKLKDKNWLLFKTK